jgi:energy-coupling factor transport system substrate-specific component
MADVTQPGAQPRRGQLAKTFTTRVWVLIPFFIGINLVGKFAVTVLGLPIFLDSIGTVLSAFLGGPLVGGLVGLLTNAVIGMTIEATSLPFGIVNAAIGIVAGVMAQRGFLRGVVRIAAVVVALTITTVVLASPIIVLVFGGVQGSGTDLVTGFFVAAGHEMASSVIGQQLVIQPLDKLVTVLAALSLARAVPARYRPQFGREHLPF